MKTITNRQFWKFEALMLLDVLFSLVFVHDFAIWQWPSLVMAAVFLLGGLLAWEVYRGDAWPKLAFWVLLFTTLLVLVSLLVPYCYELIAHPDTIERWDEHLLFSDLSIFLWVLMFWPALTVIPTLVLCYFAVEKLGLNR